MTREEQIQQEAINYARRQDDNLVYGESEAFKDGAKWADSHPQWISVEDKLPESEMFKGFLVYPVVIICTEDGFRDTGFYNTETKEWEEFRNVTHWMPLPSLPRVITEQKNKNNEK